MPPKKIKFNDDAEPIEVEEERPKKEKVNVNTSLDNKKTLQPVEQEEEELLKEQESESDDEDDDEYAELDDEEWQDQFLKILPMIQNRDPALFDKSKNFFEEKDDDGEDDNEIKPQTKKAKKFTLTDYMIERGGREVDSDEEKDINDLPLVEQQLQAKKAFLSAASLGNDDDLFQKKDKTASEIAQEEAEYMQFKLAADKKRKEKLISQDGLLKKFWDSRELDENEQFLRSYILNKDYIQRDQAPPVDPTVDVEDDELIDKQEQFEEEYNHRFSEPGSDLIVTYPRNVTSIREDPKAARRKQKKLRKKEAKAKVMDRKTEELKRIKNEKKRQILEKMKEIQQLTGGNDYGLDLENDFEPGQFEKAMLSLYADGEEEENSKHPSANLKKELDKYLEEYYSLDYEDLVGGEVPTRFNYVNVPAEDFGLTVEEILTTDEATLKEKVPLKMLAPYRKNTKNKPTKGKKWSDFKPNKYNDASDAPKRRYRQDRVRK